MSATATATATADLLEFFGMGPVATAIADELVARNKRARFPNPRDTAPAPLPSVPSWSAATASEPSPGAAVRSSSTRAPSARWPEAQPRRSSSS